MPSLRIIGSSTLVHPHEDGFALDSPHAPQLVEWSADYLKDQIRCGLTLEVTD